jgi:hypothetical protein
MSMSMSVDEEAIASGYTLQHSRQRHWELSPDYSVQNSSRLWPDAKTARA